MAKVFVVDPGYSLKEAFNQWMNGNFPGSVLYGVDKLKEFEIDPVFMNSNSVVGEKSRGKGGFFTSKRLNAEANTISELFSKKNDIDAVYIPLVNLANIVCLLRLFKIINKPVIGLIHSVNFRSKRKTLLYHLYFKSLDKIVFIAPNIKRYCEQQFPQYKHKMYISELMPEKTSGLDETKSKKYDVCLIGKTNRDYEVAAKACEELNVRGIIVGGNEAEIYGNPYVDVITTQIPYKECKKIYAESKINLITLKEADGIWGLTSILDSFSNNIPMIVTRTKELSVDIKNNGYGEEVEVGSVSDLKQAIVKLLSDNEYYKSCQNKLKKFAENSNTELFAERISEIIKEAINND